MPLPLYAAMANGGKLYLLDDTSVGADKYDAGGGPSYTAFDATLVTNPITAGPGTYSDLRRVVLDVDSGVDLTLTVQGMRDGAVSGSVISRAVAVTDSREQTIPLKVMGSELQSIITLTGWAAAATPAASLGSASFHLVPRRGSRGGNEA